MLSSQYLKGGLEESVGQNQRSSPEVTGITPQPLQSMEFHRTFWHCKTSEKSSRNKQHKSHFCNRERFYCKKTFLKISLSIKHTSKSKTLLPIQQCGNERMLNECTGQYCNRNKVAAGAFPSIWCWLWPPEGSEGCSFLGRSSLLLCV